MNKGLFLIQEHDAVRAGLHWDIRFEKNDILESFVIPKHRLPKEKEQLLAVKVNDHSWDWQFFEGKIGPGFGEGTVKCVFRDEVEMERIMDEEITKKIIFNYKGKKYQINKASWMNNPNAYLIRKIGEVKEI